jgi:hypothetical protein
MLLDLHCFHLINPQGGRGSKTALGCRKKNAARSSSKPIQCVYLRTYKYEHQTTKKIETRQDRSSNVHMNFLIYFQCLTISQNNSQSCTCICHKWVAKKTTNEK